MQHAVDSLNGLLCETAACYDRLVRVERPLVVLRAVVLRAVEPLFLGERLAVLRLDVLRLLLLLVVLRLVVLDAAVFFLGERVALFDVDRLVDFVPVVDFDPLVDFRAVDRPVVAPVFFLGERVDVVDFLRDEALEVDFLALELRFLGEALARVRLPLAAVLRVAILRGSLTRVHDEASETATRAPNTGAVVR